MKFSVEILPDDGIKLTSGDISASTGYCPISELMAGNSPYVREFGRLVGALIIMMARQGESTGP